MTPTTKSILCWGTLLSCCSWIILDVATVGDSFGGNFLPWANNSVRLGVLAFLTLLSGTVGLTFRRTQRRVNFVGSIGVIWLCCAYTVWRGYEMSKAHGDNIWFGVTFLLELLICFMTVKQLLGRYEHSA